MADIDWVDLTEELFLQGFELKHPLGHGASSFAAAAELKESKFGLNKGIKIAIRVPNESNENSLERFSREIELRKKLNKLSANEILQFHGNGFIEKSKPFIVEELADQSLYKRLLDIKTGKNTQEFSSAMMDSVIERMAKGLNYLHNIRTEGTGYLHRDIKPGNILLINGIAKLADFGSAGINSNEKKWDRDIGKANSSSGMHGTNNYSAPESLMVNGKVYYSIQSDLYSLAVTAFNLLTLRTPFDELNLENNPAELLQYKLLKGIRKTFLDEQYDKLIDENSELEYKINAIRKATLPNPSDRQKSISEFLNEYLMTAGPGAKTNFLGTYLESIIEELEKPTDSDTRATPAELIYTVKDVYKNMVTTANSRGLKGTELDRAKELLVKRWNEDYFALLETLVREFDRNNLKSKNYYVDRLWKHYGVMKAWGLDIGDGSTSGEKKFLNSEDNSSEPIRNCFDNFLSKYWSDKQ